MRAALLLLIFISLPFAAVAGRSDDKADIERAITNWDSAWKTKDWALGAQDYSSDADWTNAFGMTRTGQAEIASTLKEVFALPFVMAGDSRTTRQDVRFLDDDTALVLTRVERGGQKKPDGQPLGPRETSHLRVFSRMEGKWQIVSHLISDARNTESGSQ